MAFSPHELFGGAMTVEVPDSYYDVSKLRQVPDHQEVFQEKDGFNPLIIEILEFLPNVTATAAARFHLADYADEPAGLKIWQSEAIQLRKLLDVPAVAILATTPVNQQGVSTGIFLLNLRLEQHDTDLLITMNVKDVRLPASDDYNDLFSESADSSFRSGREIMKHVIDSFEIKDYGLFHPQTA